MKLTIVVGVAVIAALFYMAKRFKLGGGGLLRIYFAVIVIGVLIALSFGPPKYVLLKDSVRTYSVNGELVQAYQGWELNRLLPVRSFAISVLYIPESDRAIELKDAKYKPAESRFVVPKSAFSRYLWIILLVAFVANLFLVRFISRHLNARSLLQAAAEQGTVDAYEQFIRTHDKGLLRPRGLLKKANKEKTETYNRYIRRLTVLDAVNQRNAAALSMQLATDELSQADASKIRVILKSREDYSTLLNILMASIEHGRDVKSFEFDHSVTVLPGIYSKQFLSEYDGPNELIQFKVESHLQSWNRKRDKFSLPELDQIVSEILTSFKGFSDFKKEEILEVRNAIEHHLKRSLENTGKPTQKEYQALFSDVYGYLLSNHLLSLPLKSKWSTYVKNYKESIGKILLEALNRFVPDETNSEGEHTLFQTEPSQHTKKELKIKLAYSGSVTASGQLLCDQDFAFFSNGEKVVRRFGAASSQNSAKEEARPLLDALSGCTQAFKSPEQRAAKKHSLNTSELSTLRRTLKEIDDMIGEYVKEMTKEELKGHIYDQLPEEFETAAETLNLIVDIQMNSMAENGVELATSLLEFLLSAEESE